MINRAPRSNVYKNPLLPRITIEFCGDGDASRTRFLRKHERPFQALPNCGHLIRLEASTVAVESSTGPSLCRSSNHAVQRVANERRSRVRDDGVCGGRQLPGTGGSTLRALALSQVTGGAERDYNGHSSCSSASRCQLEGVSLFHRQHASATTS